MWHKKNRLLFNDCLAGLAQDPTVCEMKDIKQHGKGMNCYDHSLAVSYFSFTVCRIFGLDYQAAARAGLLHDLYLQHWETTDVKLMARLKTHPMLALENARRFFLTPMEEDIIVKHMWPLTYAMPRYKESFVVSCADKAAAALEMAHLARVLGIKKNIIALQEMQIA